MHVVMCLTNCKYTVPLFPQEFMFAESMDTDNVDQIQEFMDESIKGSSHTV